MAGSMNGIFLALSLYVMVLKRSHHHPEHEQVIHKLCPSSIYLDNHTSKDFKNVVGECYTYLFTSTKKFSHYDYNFHRNPRQLACRTLIICLLWCGDIESNPGPANVPVSNNCCGECQRRVTTRSRAISCDECNKWTHIKCTDGFMTPKRYKYIVNNNTEFDYVCVECSWKHLPFDSCGNHNGDIGLRTPPPLFNYIVAPEDFMRFKQKGIHILHLNTRSMIPKLPELRDIAYKSKAGIISISETWIDDSVSDNEIKIEGYSVLRRDRDRKGGGVCTYISDDIAFNRRSDIESDEAEVLWIELNLPKTKPIIIGTCYRPPKQTNFLTLFENMLSKIGMDSELIVVGDFNICTLTKSSLLNSYNQILSMFSLSNKVTEPTRICPTVASCLDHILCNNENKISQSGTIATGLSDHLMTFCTRKTIKLKFNGHKNAEENKNNPKKLWTIFKGLGYSNTSKDSAKTVIDLPNGTKCFDPAKIASCFNEYFTTIAANLVSKLPSPKNVYDCTSSKLKDFYRTVSGNNFMLNSVDEDFIYSELNKLNATKSTGVDKIPPRFIKDGAEILKVPITYIINLSISTSTVPEDMKKAKVIPLYKKGSRTDIGNYRPISILSTMSKILEKAVFIQIEKYLTENNVLYKYQSGFQAAFSTDTCLIDLVDSLKTQTSKGNFSVTVDDHCSQSCTVTCGVPQGSILGPLLFLCFVNDMVTCIDPDCKLLLYADDSAIVYSHRNPDIISKKLGSTLDSLCDWLVDNKLTINLDKTECILFGSKRKTKNVNNFNVSTNGNNINTSNCVKYLGIEIDQNLTCSEYACKTIKKINNRLKFMYRQRKILSCKNRKLLCSALIQCVFDYAASSWFCGTSKAIQRKLQIAQNKMVRLIKGVEPRRHIGADQLDDYGLLNVKYRVKFLQISQVHKIFMGRSASYLNENSRRVNNLHGHFTRGSKLNFVDT
ncbi:uncharacterized protein [Antedon mediterranea]|uniref:uncharacterized protein n=1 Tax=Antedon mediterranea TaxID=105859 RepID=UPI003AF8266B